MEVFFVVVIVVVIFIFLETALGFFYYFFFEISFDALPRGKIVNGRLECKQDAKQAVTACEQSTQSQKLGAFIYIYILSLSFHLLGGSLNLRDNGLENDHNANVET